MVQSRPLLTYTLQLTETIIPSQQQQVGVGGSLIICFLDVFLQIFDKNDDATCLKSTD
jgi:hypothetical protein